MKALPLLSVVLGVFFFSSLTAQVQTLEQNSEEKEFPTYTETNNPQADRLNYQAKLTVYFSENYAYPIQQLEGETLTASQKTKLIKHWNKDNIDISEVLNIKTYQEYKDFRYASKVLNYPAIPSAVSTGDLSQDEADNKAALKEWMGDHPDYPKYIDMGNPEQDKKTFRLAKLAFYDKYIKTH